MLRKFGIFLVVGNVTGCLGLLRRSLQGAAVQQPVTAKQSAVAGEPYQ